jgi:hypothetical protein
MVDQWNGRNDGPADTATSGSGAGSSDRPVEQATRRIEAEMTPSEPKEKVTYTLPRRLRRLIDNLAADLGIDPCDVVVRLMTPALKGASRPTIPAAIRAQLGEDVADAGEDDTNRKRSA